MIQQFKEEMASGELANVLGINKNLSGEQEQSLKRLEDNISLMKKWATEGK